MFARLFRTPGRAPGESAPGEPARAPAGRSASGDTQTVREIVARLQALPVERARFLAGFAYVMSRAAEADLEISDDEVRVMEQVLIEQGALDEPQAALVVGMARLEARRLGATEDYLVTREFARIASLEEKLAALHGCFAVAAANGSISAEEATVVNEIARELDLDPKHVNEVRAEFVDKLSAIQAQRRLTAQE